MMAAAGGETRRIITEGGCGLCTPPRDAAALAESIVKLKDMMDERPEALKRFGDNSRDYCERFFNKGRIMGELDEYFIDKAS